MSLFKKKNKKLQRKSKKFDRKIAEVNRMLTHLEIRISEYQRKLMTYKMRGPMAQSLHELDFLLRDMHREAEEIQVLLDESRDTHENCVKLVEDMMHAFEEEFGEGHNEDSTSQQ